MTSATTTTTTTTTTKPIVTYQAAIKDCNEFHATNYATYKSLIDKIDATKKEWQERVGKWTAEKTKVTATDVQIDLSYLKTLIVALSLLQEYQVKHEEIILKLETACAFFSRDETIEILTQAELAKTITDVLNIDNKLAKSKDLLIQQKDQIAELAKKTFYAMDGLKRDMERLLEYVHTGSVNVWYVSQAKKTIGYTPFLDKALETKTDK